MTRRPLLAAALLTTAALLAGCASVVDDGPDPTPAVVEGERTPATSPAAPGLVVPTDGGPRSQAQGEVSSVVGTLTYYTPASSDTLTGVAARFGLCIADLEAANGNSDITAGEEIVVARTTATPLDDRACLG
ncbi:LysM peptidoglycan-binding domain-containing protein [Clavibacter michiganensis]|uniref:LysM peptidoglycan-binding domain-containing protein n=2 Tax=Clavibacter michiganensis TaxID=28447 RepID=UPI0011788D34|nr:LysM domain-containing protein [Clavibacter michiganensis]MBW8025977.1 LysM domain-containing protein [Clavibacter michiganensis subsp. michiganensis]MDO4032325.1 LysM domain-containing protein [Clavibacter michiganensis]MDO4081657.1 LysM domain-containing protein [Clavibacter michiganensis]MDO4086889.1 LysM domain-containing protein [Clavibacter michiganensis]MDO4097604.1 LysM domain-containing protein [Clavibacter michiganensis]